MEVKSGLYYIVHLAVLDGNGSITEDDKESFVLFVEWKENGGSNEVQTGWRKRNYVGNIESDNIGSVL